MAMSSDFSAGSYDFTALGVESGELESHQKDPRLDPRSRRLASSPVASSSPNENGVRALELARLFFFWLAWLFLS